MILMTDKNETCFACGGMRMEEVDFTYEYDGEDWETKARQCRDCFSVYVPPEVETADG
jgi:hypothetical protein